LIWNIAVASRGRKEMRERAINNNTILAMMISNEFG